MDVQPNVGAADGSAGIIYKYQGSIPDNTSKTGPLFVGFGGFGGKKERIALTDSSSHNGNMDAVSRPELDSKLEAVEARMDARLSKFDSDMRQVVNEFRLEIAPLKSLKANVWGGTAVVVATIFAAVAMSFGAFDSGRETATLTLEAAQQTKETKALLDQMKRQQDAVPTPPPAK